MTSKQVSTFDGLGRLDTRTGYEGSNVIYTYGYDYDANGNVTDIVETYTNGLSDRTLEMEYDDVDRLELENITEGGVLTSTEYEYDAANNRTIRAVTVGSNPTVTGTHAYNTLNQLTGVTFSDTTPAISFSYDAQGNRTSREQDSMLSSYAYDRENRLTAVQLGGEFKTIAIHPVMGSTLGAPTVATYRLGGGGTLHTYAYDYRTRRVKRTEDGETTNVVFSGGTAILEMTGTDATPSAPTVEFVRGDGMGGGVGGMLYSERSGTTSVSHNNNRGDIVAKVTGTDANPYTVTYQAAYEAFGTRKAEDGSTADRQKANTKDEDPTGLLNEGFRFRDLETGTFLTRDPAGFVDGPNLYAYVVQNPWTKFDPEGLSEAWPWGESWYDYSVVGTLHHAIYDAAYGITSAVSAVGSSIQRMENAEITGRMQSLDPIGIEMSRASQVVEALPDLATIAASVPGTSITGPAALPESVLPSSATVGKLGVSKTLLESGEGAISATSIARGGFGGADQPFTTLPGGTGRAFAGHGVETSMLGSTIIPEGTTLTLPVRPGVGATINDSLGRLIEAGDWDGAFARFPNQMQGAASYLPGASVPNLLLRRPGGLTVLENSAKVNTETPLSSLLKPNMGHMDWAACMESW